MNPRVLELLKSPKNIQSEDLGLLKEEINTFPYVQNIRALHLFGVHLYDKENYQKELSTTAAYTTDKKLLYQLINGKAQRESRPEITEDKQPSKTLEKPVKYSYKNKAFPIKREESSESRQDKYEEAAQMVKPVQEIKHMHVNGERNRILFEGEENFLDETNSEVIDLESTLESGVIVTQKTEYVAVPDQESIAQTENQNIGEQEDSEAGVEFTPELIVEENKIDSPAEEQVINKESEVSFHEVETLAPETETSQETEENNPVEEPVATETQVDSETINEDNSINEPHAEISFHGMDEFMPDVKIQVNTDNETVAPEVSKPSVNKHEEEMRRLIEEVEKKMKEAQSAPQVKNEEPEAADHEISFAETQSFHFWSTEKEEPKIEKPAAEEVKDSLEQPVEQQEPVEAEVKKEEKPEMPVQPVSSWKPMSLDSHLPDSMISKETKVSTPDKETPKQEEIPVIEERQEEVAPQIVEELQKETEAVQKEELPAAEKETPEIVEEKNEEVKNSEESLETREPKEEVPVMNVSFFGADISSLAVDKTAKEEPVEEIKAENSKQAPADSNVPGFINTWQSWLKINRPAEEPVKKEKIPVQEKVIEAFIENNPKISQLRDESTYVVKEKNDDISHLMTETLANLYFEQKLYTKAIKAFEILINKNPEKKEYFQSRIQEIKDFRSKG